MSKQPPPAPNASAVGPCPTIIQISRTPRRWKFTQHHHTTRPPPIEKERFGKLGHYGCLVLPAYFKIFVMMNAYCLNKFFCAYCRATNESDMQYCLYLRFEKVGGILVYICPWFRPSFVRPSVRPSVIP